MTPVRPLHAPATRRRVFSCALLAACLMTGACSRYYRITDAQTGDVYYTESFDARRAAGSGQARFVDARTAALIRLEQFEVKKIGRQAFRRGMRQE